MLLKNGESAKKPLLPLPKKSSKILVAGSHADNIGNQCGGWTITWQGKSGDITTGKYTTSFCYLIVGNKLLIIILNEYIVDLIGENVATLFLLILVYGNL